MKLAVHKYSPVSVLYIILFQWVILGVFKEIYSLKLCRKTDGQTGSQKKIAASNKELLGILFRVPQVLVLFDS